MSYAQSALSSFPDNIDVYTKKRDPSNAEKTLISQIHDYIKVNDFTNANLILTNNPNLLECQLTADALNKLYDSMGAVQQLFKDDIQTYIQSVMSEFTEVQLSNKIGDLTALQTNNKTSTVEAINENKTKIDSIETQITSMSGIPSGIIVMWSGAIINVPTGWQLCNGSNGAPDLRDRFIVGAGNSYSVGGTGGTNSNNISHDHTINATTSNNGGHAHSFSGSTSTASASAMFDIGGTQQSQANTTNHAHTFTGNTASSGVHSHTITETTSTNGDTDLDNRPPYYALAYIMKL